MKEFQQKRRIQRRLYSKTTLVILALVTILMVKAVWTVYWKKAESEKSLEKISSEYRALEERNKSLSASIARLKTENGIEEEIHEKFNVAKEGEKVAIIVEDRNATPTPTAEKKGFFRKVLDLFR